MKFKASKSIFSTRHVVSAGHCICNLLRHQPDAHQDSLCRPTFPALPMNQIVHGYNQIRVYGGSKDTKVLLSKSNKANRFSVERAILWDTISDPKTEVFLEKPDVVLHFFVEATIGSFTTKSGKYETPTKLHIYCR